MILGVSCSLRDGSVCVSSLSPAYKSAGGAETRYLDGCPCVPHLCLEVAGCLEAAPHLLVGVGYLRWHRSPFQEACPAAKGEGEGEGEEGGERGRQVLVQICNRCRYDQFVYEFRVS